MKTLLPIVLLGTLFAPSTHALPAEQRGLQIAQEMDRRDLGWVDQQAELKMILRNSRGDENTRQLHIKTLEIKGDGDKSLTVFVSPPDIAGTALLSHTHALRPDDQWLYLPALKRVKRIASANQSGPFMGSEFAYEDMTSQELKKYTYKYLRDTNLDGRDTFVIERYPVYDNSGYSRQVMWIDKKIYQPLRLEFYDRKNAQLKTLTLYEYQEYLDKYWRPKRMEMVNHQTGKQTTLLWKDYEFGTGLHQRDFASSSLRRLR